MGYTGSVGFAARTVTSTLPSSTPLYDTTTGVPPNSCVNCSRAFMRQFREGSGVSRLGLLADRASAHTASSASCVGALGAFCVRGSVCVCESRGRGREEQGHAAIRCFCAHVCACVRTSATVHAYALNDFKRAAGEETHVYAAHHGRPP